MDARVRDIVKSVVASGAAAASTAAAAVPAKTGEAASAVNRTLVREWVREALADVRPANTGTTGATTTGATGGGGELDRDLVAQIVAGALERFAADRLGSVDWALASGGAEVVGARTSASYGGRGLLSALLRPYGPSVALQPSTQLAHCWSFAGGAGQLTVRLPFAVRVRSVSIDHVSALASPDMRSAPREFRVTGALAAPPADVAAAEAHTLLAHGVYQASVHAPAVQTFAVDDAAQSAAPPVRFVTLDVQSNHGHDEFTCLYRFRVHGDRVDV